MILFMIYKYKIFGLIANTALVANLLMLIGTYNFSNNFYRYCGNYINQMAVDANVLIFERIKELKTEKSIIHAFDAGYSRAKITVLEQMLTLIVVLFYLLLDLGR